MNPRYRQHKKKKANAPQFEQMRRTNDAAHIADAGFRKQLWAVDKELDVVWNQYTSKFEIWKFPKQAGKVPKKMDELAKHVMTIQDANKNFRELGADILLKLQEFSFERFTVNQICAYLDAQDEHIRAIRQKDFENRIESITQESIDYIRGVKKVSVPAKIKPSDHKYLLDLVKEPKINVKIFKPRTTSIIASAVRADGA